MRKLKKAIFCYCLTRARCAVLWILLLSPAQKTDGWLTIGSDGREQLADWVLADLFKKKMDFDDILHFLSGDEYYERNKKDVGALEKETGRAITTIWDTDPIFAKYPHLRGFGRNKKFEEMWFKMKQKVK